MYYIFILGMGCDNMKKRQKLLAVLIALLIVISSGELIIYANIKTSTAKATLLQEGEYNIQQSNINYSNSAMFGLFDTPTVQEYIYEELLNCSTSINIYNYRVNTDDLINVYSDIINSNPDLFYVSSSITYTYTTTGYVYEIRPHYSMNSSEIIEAKVIFENGVQRALSVVDNSMNDVQKALVIHDYICDIATYPVLNSSADDKDIYHSAYGLFYDGNVVCAGYALAYSYILNLLGIPCEYVASNAMNHAWNAVQIDGKWYNVDLTWDDMSLYNNSMNLRGGMFHNCFLKSDEAFGGEIGRYHFGGTTYDNCVMSDTSYDNYFWNNLTSNICVVDGDYYYFEQDGTAFRGYLKKRDLNGSVSTVSDTAISCIKMNVTGTNVDENGVSHTHTMVDPFVRVVYLDNRFYLTSVRQIISIDISGNRHTILNEDNYCFGLGTTDNELVYQEYSTFNSYQLDKIQYFNEYLSTDNFSVYNNYPDINNDGSINAKDYAMIIK